MSFIRYAAHLAASLLIAIPVISGFAATSAATVIYDSTGGAENGGDSFASAGTILLDEIAVPKLKDVYRLKLNLAKTTATVGKFDVVAAIIDASGRPKMKTVIATLSDAKLTTTFQLVEVTVPAAISMTIPANRPIYVGIAAHPKSTSSVILGNTVDPAVLARPAVVAGGFYYNNGGKQANAGGPYEIKLTASVH